MTHSKQAPYVICYLCGRKYGTKSIEIHEPQCRQKWELENAKLPKQQRRKLPPKPDYSILLSANYSEGLVDKMNEMAFQAAQEQLIPCQHCGRTFLPDRLLVHQRSCTSDRPGIPRADASSTIDLAAQRRGAFHQVRPKANDARRVLVPKSDISFEGQSHVRRTSLGKVGRSMDSLRPSRFFDGEDSFELNSGPEPGEELRRFEVGRSSSESIASRADLSDVELMKPKMSLEEAIVKNTEVSSDDPFLFGHTNIDHERPATRTIQRGRRTIPSVHISPDFDGGSLELTTGNVAVVPCSLCGRSFREDRLLKHSAICRKASSKKRKLFDSSRKRSAGAEALALRQKAIGKADIAVTKSNWRQAHEDFIKSIRAAKQIKRYIAKGGNLSDLPPPPPSLNLDYVYCQYCDRRFNPEVAKRHVPKCKETINRPKPPKQKAINLHQFASAATQRSSVDIGKPTSKKQASKHEVAKIPRGSPPVSRDFFDRNSNFGAKKGGKVSVTRISSSLAKKFSVGGLNASSTDSKSKSRFDSFNTRNRLGNEGYSLPQKSTDLSEWNSKTSKYESNRDQNSRNALVMGTIPMVVSPHTNLMGFSSQPQKSRMGYSYNSMKRVGKNAWSFS